MYAGKSLSNVGEVVVLLPFCDISINLNASLILYLWTSGQKTGRRNFAAPDWPGF